MSIEEKWSAVLATLRERAHRSLDAALDMGTGESRLIDLVLAARAEGADAIEAGTVSLSQRDRAALSRACPRCDAEPGEPCIGAASPPDPPTPPTERERALVRASCRNALDAADRVRAGLSERARASGEWSMSRDMSDGLCDAIIASVDRTHPRADAEPRYSRADVERVVDEVVDECDGCDDPAEQVTAQDRAAIITRVLGAPSEVEAAERRYLDAMHAAEDADEARMRGDGSYEAFSAASSLAVSTKHALRAARENAGGAARVGARRRP